MYFLVILSVVCILFSCIPTTDEMSFLMSSCYKLGHVIVGVGVDDNSDNVVCDGGGGGQWCRCCWR